MTVSEAIAALRDAEASTGDPKLSRKLSGIINDMEDYMNSPERGGNHAIPDEVARLVPNSRLDNVDRASAGRLQQAVLDMMYGKSRNVSSYVLLGLTLVLTLIGILIPLIFSKLNDDMWYFSIESAKDIASTVFDCLGAGCGISLGLKIKRENSESRWIAGIILIVIGIVGAVVVTLLAWFNPYSGAKVYYTIFEVMSILFAVFGMITAWVALSKKQEED